MTNDKKFSRVDTEQENVLKAELANEKVEIVSNTKKALENYTKQKLDIPNANTIDDNLKIFEEFKKSVLANEKNVEKFDVDFLRKLKRSKPSDLLQKTVYKLDDGENIENVYNALKNEDSGAIFKAIKKDTDNNTITVYSSRFGVWDTFDGVQIKMNETNGNLLRVNFADRQMSNPAELQDVARQNYTVAEDLRTLFKKGLIQEFTKGYNYKLTNIHFKKELTSDDLQKFAKVESVKKDIVKEKSHTSKTNANAKEVAEALKTNKKEIHSVIKIDEEFEEVEKYESHRTQTAEEYVKKLEADLREQQQKELLKLEEKIKLAKNERKKAKEDAIKLLAGGMNLNEVANELAAKKYNDITVKLVAEDLKTEILDSVKKEAELNKTTHKLQKTEKNLIETEQKRQNIYKNYTEELARRKDIENKAKIFALKLKDAASVIVEKDKIIQSQMQTIVSLQDQKEELAEDLKTANENIEMLESELAEKDKTIQTKNQNIVVLEKDVSEKSKKIDYIEVEIIEKTEENFTLKSENSDIKTELKKQASKIEELLKVNDATALKIQELKQINKQMFEENLALKESLKNLKSVEKELEKYKKNSEIKENYTSKINKIKEEVETDDEFDNLMKELDKIQNPHKCDDDDNDEMEEE